MGYVPVERWEIAEVMLFVRREIEARTYWLTGHTILLGALVAFGLYAGWREAEAGAALFAAVLLPLGLGVLAMALIIVPHELIHGLAYRLVGAGRILYGADWRSLVFHASAPGFVVDYARMRLVALAPFVVLSLCLGMALSTLDGAWWWGAYGLTLAHTQGCLGDAAMLNAFARQDEPGAWVTYDDAAEPQFVFMRREGPANEKGATESQ